MENVIKRAMKKVSVKGIRRVLGKQIAQKRVGQKMVGSRYEDSDERERERVGRRITRTRRTG